MGRKALNKKRSNNPDKKREWIKTLYPYLQEHGLKDVTMDNIAAYLQKSKATVYKYFNSKDEIVSMTISQKLEQILAFEAILNDQNIPFTERYYGLLQHLAIAFSDISVVLLQDIKAYYPQQWERVIAFTDYTIQVLMNFYQNGIALGVFNDVNPKMLGLTDRIFLNALTNPEILLQYELSIQEAFEQYFKMKFFGLLKRADG